METPPASPAQPLTSKLSKALSTTWTLLSSITAGLRSIFRNRAVQLWHSSARWKWLELLVIGLFATAIAVDEYIAAVVFAFLAALGALSRLLHSEIRVTWKVLGSVGVVVLLLYLTAISTAKIGEKPISNLIILRDRFITIQQLPRNKMPDILRRAPTPDWASRQHSDTHIDLPPSVPPFKDTLVINALAGNGNYVEGSRIGTIDPITWKSYYSEVTVIFVNTSPEDYDAFDVSVDPDQVIFGASQVTAVPGVSIFSPSGGPGTQLPPEQIGPLPPGRVLLLPNNVDSSPRRVRCEKFPGKLPMRVIFAVVNVKFPPQAKHGHALLFGYGLPDLNPKTLPKWVRIEGSYKLNGRVFHVSKTQEFTQSYTP